jgi:hypothetical protein
MPRWLTRTLARIRTLVLSDRVRFTRKARQERLALRIDLEEAHAILRTLRPADSSDRHWSDASADWLYVFRPVHGRVHLYIKAVLREACVVVSFHDDEGHDDEAR